MISFLLGLLFLAALGGGFLSVGIALVLIVIIIKMVEKKQKKRRDLYNANQ